MLKAITCIAVLGLGLGSCVSGESLEGGVPDGGVTGATIKRAAVQSPDALDFGHDIDTVEPLDLEGATAGMDKTVASSDAERDTEIDAIVNEIGKEEKKDPAAAKPNMTPPVASGRSSGSAVPAVAPDSKTNLGDGVTAETGAHPSKGGLPKPYWRREIEKEREGDPSPNPLPRGI